MLRLKAGRLRVELWEGSQRLSVWESMLAVEAPPAPLAAGTRIPVTVDVPAGVVVRNYPVTFGVPFPAGVLWDLETLRVVTAAGGEVPSQQGRAGGLLSPDFGLLGPAFCIGQSSGADGAVRSGVLAAAAEDGPHGALVLLRPRRGPRREIYFDGPAMVYDSAGQPLADKPLPGGWTDLPADRPGLWSFEAIEARLVRVHNLPPVFAAGTPESFFMPPVEWVKDAPPITVPPIPAGTTYIPGAGADPADKAIYLDSNRTFVLDGGTQRGDNQGGQFLPFPQGTIEFFVRAHWDVADLPDGTGYLVRLIAAPEHRTLGYMKNSKSDNWLASHYANCCRFS